MNRIVFDVMIGDRFYDTFRLPIELGMIQDFHGEVPVFNLEAIKRKVLEKRPTLKGKDFRICF